MCESIIIMLCRYFSGRNLGLGFGVYGFGLWVGGFGLWVDGFGGTKPSTQNPPPKTHQKLYKWTADSSACGRS